MRCAVNDADLQRLASSLMRCDCTDCHGLFDGWAHLSCSNRARLRDVLLDDRSCTQDRDFAKSDCLRPPVIEIMRYLTNLGTHIAVDTSDAIDDASRQRA